MCICALPSTELYFLRPVSFLLLYPFVLFITGLSKCNDAPYFTGCNYPSTPPLPAPHSAQIQKNSFHYCCLTKGHIRQCGVVSVSTDAFSGPTHPLAVLRVPLSTCPTPPFSLPLWLSNPWHYLSLSSELLPLMTSPSPTQPLIVSFQLDSSSPYGCRRAPSSPTPNFSPHPGGKECALRDSCCRLLIPPHFVFRRKK